MNTRRDESGESALARRRASASNSSANVERAVRSAKIATHSLHCSCDLDFYYNNYYPVVIFSAIEQNLIDHQIWVVVFRPHGNRSNEVTLFLSIWVKSRDGQGVSREVPLLKRLLFITRRLPCMQGFGVTQFTLVTGPRRPLSLKLSDTRVYEP